MQNYCQFLNRPNFFATFFQKNFIPNGKPLTANDVAKIFFFNKMSGGAQDAENGRTRGTLLRGGRSLEGEVAATEPRHGERAAARRGLAAAGGRDGAAAWRTGLAARRTGGDSTAGGPHCCGWPRQSRGMANEPRHGEREATARRGDRTAAGGRDRAAAWRTGRGMANGLRHGWGGAAGAAHPQLLPLLGSGGGGAARGLGEEVEGLLYIKKGPLYIK